MTPALQPYVTAAYRAGAGHRPDQRYVDFRTAFAENPALVSEARAELQRLTARGGNRTLAEHDYESKIAAQTLARMLQQFDAQGAKAA
jgi:hypothetical protein